MSNYYIDLHSNTLNLLGSLEEVMDSCIIFRNFLPCANITIPSLEGLMVNTPLTPISQSIYLGKPLSSSVALPFIQSGYHTNLVTGAKLGWRNLGKFASIQYFQTVEGRSAILAKVKGAQSCEWGVFDEYMFERVYEILEQSNGAPQFVFAISTTNHTPFELPENYKPDPVNLPEEIKKALRTNEKIAIKNFTNYQYANDCLGKFIKKIKNSSFSNNTIIVATGDHNTLQLFNLPDNQLLQKLSVPLVFYIPESYTRNCRINTSRFGSHKDIFSTIFNLVLPDITYLKSGNNLFDENTGEKDFFAVYNYSTGMNMFGCVSGLSSPLFFRWTTNNPNLLEPTTLEETPELKILLQKTRAFSASMSYYIQTELSKK